MSGADRHTVTLLALAFVTVTNGCARESHRAPADPDAPPVALRPENLTVLPSTGPLMHVRIANLRDEAYSGTVLLAPPEGWRLDAAEKPVTIGPRGLARVPFAIERGVDSAGNAYPMEIRAASGGREVVWRGTVAAATTPYYRPVIDGKLDDWADAVPFVFTTGGKETAVCTYWSRRDLSILVSVEEDAHEPMGGGAGAFDAVQVAVAPAGAATPRSPGGRAERHEFLLADAAGGGACFLLTKPGDVVPAPGGARPLAGLEVEGARIAVARSGGVTSYECAIPFRAMPGVRAEPGREYRLSVLVHDPRGTGLRDLGEAAGLWPWQRTRLAWNDWQGAAWPDEAPFDGKIEWGFSSSIR